MTGGVHTVRVLLIGSCCTMPRLIQRLGRQRSATGRAYYTLLTLAGIGTVASLAWRRGPRFRPGRYRTMSPLSS